jgi:hypothetical protein
MEGEVELLTNPNDREAVYVPRRSFTLYPNDTLHGYLRLV